MKGGRGMDQSVIMTNTGGALQIWRSDRRDARGVARFNALRSKERSAWHHVNREPRQICLSASEADRPFQELKATYRQWVRSGAKQRFFSLSGWGKHTGPPPLTQSLRDKPTLDNVLDAESWAPDP